MFADAVQKASQFTFPAISAALSHSGACSSGMGTFVVINKDGWILTCKHILEHMQGLADSKARYDQYDLDLAATDGLEKKERQAARRKLRKREPGDVRGFALNWHFANTSLAETAASPIDDIAVGRLANFDPDSVSSYPVFKNPNDPLLQGASLCRLGYPFCELDVTCDPKTQDFQINHHGLALFPLEGMFTRDVRPPIAGGGQGPRFVETSSPGLMGQSGGPILDKDGAIWAIQSATRHLELGFAPRAKAANGPKPQIEHQFLNVGLGVHVERIITLLDSCRIDYNLSK